MNLKTLKKNATVSELSLIEMVEHLVRSEYDIVKLRKDIHDELKSSMYEEVTKVLDHHNLLSGLRGGSALTYGDKYYVREILWEIGDALRLELGPKRQHIIC